MSDIDTSDIRKWHSDLLKGAAGLITEVTAVGDKAAVNIKKDWAQSWAGHSHIPALPASIDYDRKYGMGTITYEIGPNKKKRQGALGNIIEFGTLNNAPIPGGLPALQKEEPQVAEWLARVLGEAME